VTDTISQRCAACSEPAAPGRKRCAACAEYEANKALIRYYDHKARGVCVRCLRRAVPGEVLCLLHCRAARLKYQGRASRTQQLAHANHPEQQMQIGSLQ
jgi:hypothetical protein